MKNLFTNLFLLPLVISLIVQGCVTTNGSYNPVVGPKDSDFVKNKENFKLEKKVSLNIAIPLFDPNIPNNQINDRNFVWPELRKAEANRFPLLLKNSLDNLATIGSVRVTPDPEYSSDVYIIGKILKSDGKNLNLDIKIYDITGKKISSKIFKYKVEETFFNDVRKKGRDAYEPAFDKIAKFVEKKIKRIRNTDKLKKVSEMRFATNLNNAQFSQYLNIKNNKFNLSGFPNSEDPMLKRVRAVKYRDDLFIDNIQDVFSGFYSRSNPAYLDWQEKSFVEISAYEKARSKATWNAIGGAVLIGLAAAAAGSASNSGYDYDSATANTAAAVVAGAAGVAMFSNSAKAREESELHKLSAIEFGQTYDLNMQPQVLEFNNEKKQLTGTVKEQFSQWRSILKEIYELEKVPDINLM